MTLVIGSDRILPIGSLHSPVIQNHENGPQGQFALSMFQNLEVDVVLEAADKRIAGVEVKASMDVSPADFRGLRNLAASAGKRFTRGFLLHTGNNIIQYAPNLWALPVSYLWK